MTAFESSEECSVKPAASGPKDRRRGAVGKQSNAMSKILQGRSFYGWWIVVAAFLNLFFTTGIVYYGFPVFYPSLIVSLGCIRQQPTAGIFFVFVMLPPLLAL